MMTNLNHRLAVMLLACLLLAARSTLAEPAAYDPLAAPAQFTPATADFTVHDAERNRDLPIRVYLPQAKTPAAVVLFSHGLGGSCKGNAYLGNHWSARGYVAVFLQHPGSDTAVWKDEPVGRRLAAMQNAAGLANYLLRVKDVPAVLNQLERWNKTAGHALAGRLDLARVGMSGHSFGAVTTQGVSGQCTKNGKMPFTDPRIKAAVAFSPSNNARGGDAGPFFGKVKIPWLLMTGTHDISFIGTADMKSRLAVFPALPPGGKYEVVLYGAEHSAFGDGPLPGDKEKRNPNHHRVILALSTAFWDAYLRGDAAAKTWLDGDGPRTVLEKDDRWQRK